jgi:hypothetical protein
MDKSVTNEPPGQEERVGHCASLVVSFIVLDTMITARMKSFFTGSSARSSRVRRAAIGGSIAALGIFAFASLGTLRADTELPLTGRLTGVPANDFPDGTACASKIAIDAEVFGYFCTNTCSATSDCPEGWSCKRTWQGGAPPIALCRPNRLGIPSAGTP